MARSNPPTEPQPANLSTAQMIEAIPKIERRIKDVEEFDPNSVRDRSDPRISALEIKLAALLENIFGHGTIEHNRYFHKITKLDKAAYYAGGTPHGEVLEGLNKGKSTILHHLKELILQFQEELGDKGATPVGSALRAYENLDLHPEIQRAAGDLYRDGHYANAIEDSVKALNALVRLRSGEDSKDGTTLMEHVFSPKNPILKFNSLVDQSDLDEQKGFMMLFSGAVAGLRNPRAHKIIKDDPESALEFIAFISLLAKLADKAKK
jgi:uncharacterized protein (TIGR02391 family)